MISEKTWVQIVRAYETFLTDPDALTSWGRAEIFKL